MAGLYKISDLEEIIDKLKNENIEYIDIDILPQIFEGQSKCLRIMSAGLESEDTKGIIMVEFIEAVNINE